MNLTRVELTRLASRRFLRLLPLLVLAVLVMTWYGVNEMARWSVSAPEDSLAAYEQAVRDWQEYGEEWTQECLDDQEREREAAGDPTLDFGCSQLEPLREHYIYEPDLLREHEVVLSGVGFVLLFLGLLAGATSTAAEYTHRTMGTWLTFEPRRTRVFFSKVGAAAILVLPVALISCAVLLLGISAIFRFHGVPSGLDSSDWGHLAWASLRLGLLIALVAAVGAAAGMLVRNTAGVLGGAVGYVFAVELVLMNIIERLSRFSLSRNVDAWVQDGVQWSTYQCDEFRCTEQVIRLSMTQGAIFLLILSLAVLLISWLRFTRSDAE